MSAKLLRGDLNGVLDFRWQPGGPADARLPDRLMGSPVQPTALRQRPAKSAEEAALLSFEQQLDALRQEAADARAHLEAEAQSAFQRGLVEGRRMAEDAARGELAAHQGRLAHALNEIAKARQELLSQTDAELVRLSVAIAEKVLNRQLQVDADALRGIAHAALERLAGRPVQAVRLHPDDLHAVQQEFAGTTTAMQLVADSSLAPGSLLFETEYGVLDSSITTQLEEIERGLVDRLQRSTR